MAEPSARAIVETEGRAALAAIEEAVADRDSHTSEKLSHVVARLVTLRNGLIARRRAGEPCAEYLAQSNALISALIGTEFPVNGLQWDRVCETRDALTRLLAAG